VKLTTHLQLVPCIHTKKYEYKITHKLVKMKRTLFWEVTPCTLLMLSDVSEERTNSIFRIEV
jgi:hypothetical protein